MRLRRRFESILATLLLLLARCIGIAAAQDQNADASVSYPSSAPGQSNTDPPGRVARVQYISGEVSIQPGGLNDWIAANMNRPLTTSDRVWTDKNSKAELNVGGGYIRMNSETSLALSNVNDNTVQLELDQGTLEITVRYLGPGQIYEVDTPNVAFTVMKPGMYRFNVYPSEDQTWVTVRQGQGEATGRGNAVKVKSGEQVRFSAGNSLQHTAEAAPSPDGFDDWAKVRDQRLDSSQSARYVAPGVIGYEDLDTYGRWQTVAPYGPVWTPYSVPVGWAPYRFGHWVWIAPWGWTWVDDAPWGFAPFHYGRWVNWGGYWGWAPGPYRYWRPCYAPALVAWVGGPGWGVGFGFGGPGWGVGVNFGWFPLGWGEPFYPWYHGWHGHGLSSTYVRNVNITNTHITNITNVTNNYHNNTFVNTHYVNRNVSGAMTAAPASAIANGQPINRFGAPVPRKGMTNAQLVRNISAIPTRQAFLGGQTPRNNGTPPASARSVVTRAAPPVRPPFNAPSGIGAPSLSNSQASKGSLPGAPGATTAAGAAATTARNPNAAPAARNGNASNVPRPPSATSGQYAGGQASTAQNAANASHNVPRPPTAIAERSNAPASSGVTSHNVPRPPAQSGYMNGSSNTTTYGNSNTMHPATEPRSVPRPPATGEVQHAPAAAPPHVSSPANMPPAHQSAPAHEAQPQGKPKSEPKGENPGMASAAPRPPTNYAYRAAPTYGTESRGYSGSAYADGSGYGRANGYAGGSPYSAAPSSGGHASYPAAPPRVPSASYHTYSSVPSYGMHSAAPAVPHYSAPAAGYSGGAAHYSSPSGGGYSSGGSGGASHASHGSSSAHTR